MAERDRQMRTDAAAIPPRSSWRSSAGAPTRSRRPSGSGISTIYADYQDIKQYAEAVAAVRRGSARRRSTWRPRGSRSRARPTSSAIWPSKGPTASWSAMRAACAFARSAASRSWRISRSMRPIRSTVELLKSRGALPGDGLVRPERRPARGPARRDAPVVARGRDPSADSRCFTWSTASSVRSSRRVPTRPTAAGRATITTSSSATASAWSIRSRPTSAVATRSTTPCRRPPPSICLGCETHGARFLRIEFLDDAPEAVERTITLYREVIAGDRDGKSLWRELKATNQYGVTRGPLAVIA